MTVQNFSTNGVAVAVVFRDGASEAFILPAGRDVTVSAITSPVAAEDSYAGSYGVVLVDGGAFVHQVSSFQQPFITGLEFGFPMAIVLLAVLGIKRACGIAVD